MLCLGYCVPHSGGRAPSLQARRNDSLLANQECQVYSVPNFEFQKAANVGARAMPFETTEAQESTCGIRPESWVIACWGRGREQESLALCDKIKFVLLSLTWLLEAYHLCGVTYLVTSGLRQFLECGSEFQPVQLFISSGTLSRLLNAGVTDWQPGAVSCQQTRLIWPGPKTVLN